MMGLLRSDLCVLEGHRALLPAGFGLFLLCVPLGLVSAVEFVVLTALLLPALPLLARHKAEDGGFWAYLAAGPLGRRRLVLGKYLEALLAALVPLASIPLLLLLARSPLAGPAALPSLLLAGGAYAGLGLCFQALLLPLSFRLPQGWSEALAMAGYGGTILVLLALTAPLGGAFPPACLLLLPIGAALFACSLPASLRIFAEKEL